MEPESNQSTIVLKEVLCVFKMASCFVVIECDASKTYINSKFAHYSDSKNLNDKFTNRIVIWYWIFICHLLAGHAKLTPLVLQENRFRIFTHFFDWCFTFVFAESKYLSWLIFHICVCWKSVFAFDEYQYLIGFAWIARTINQNYPSPGWQCRCLPSEISSTLKSFCFSLNINMNFIKDFES